MSNEIIYGKNLLSKKLISNKKFRGICYHKNKKFIYKPLETTKPINKKEKYDFIITTKKPHDRAAYELLKLSFINSKFYDYKKKIFTDNKKDIDILNYSKKLSNFKKYIDKYHVISFDLFETLLDKNFSSNSDIYEVVNLKIKNKKYIKYRYEIEKKLVHKKNFIINYDEILDNLQKKIDCNNQYKKKIKKLEEEIELSNLFVRKEISELLFYAKKKKKKIILSSDTWFDLIFIKKILKKNKINIFDKIYLSSNLKKSKFNGEMYESIRNDFGGKILHIGDNPISDKKNLIKKNIKSLLVPTLNSIILNSNFSSIYAFNQSIFAKVFIGLIKKKISYIIYKSVKLKKFSIYNLKDFGYIFFSILNFIFSNYLINISKKNKIQKLLLCSREGYFFNQTLNFLKKINVNIPNYSYFITSRKLSTISAIYNENDIIDSFKKHRFLGLFKDLTQERFNITLSKENIKNSNYLIDTRRDTLKLKMLLKIENDKIINKSLQIRNEYKKYILKQFSNYRIAFVDQGFYGTSQKSIEKIFNRKFFGIYVCLKDKDYYKKCLFDFKNSYFYNHQIFFESLFTGPKGSVININRKGNFIFQKKFKNQKKFDDKRVIFSGMLDFIRDLNKIVNINYHTDNIFLENDCKEIADCLFGLMKKNKKNLSNKILNTFYHDNQFVKKKTYKLNL